MTQITNVLMILIFTLVFSVVTVFLTIFIDKILDIHTIISNIPRVIAYNNPY